jgi:hypothetical protein
MKWHSSSCVLLLCLVAGCAGQVDDPLAGNGHADSIVWIVDSLDSVAGHPTQILGSPRVVETPHGPAVEFDGIDDGLIVDLHPLAGAAEFTVEALFRPDPGGEREQRFLHLQETGSSDRMLLETRLKSGGRWYLDTYVKTGGEAYTLISRQNRHPLGEWYHVALVVRGGGMGHYVNGKLERARPIAFAPQRPGRTSIGVRINEVSWFKGAIREVRFTPRALAPEEFRSVPASP